MNKYAFVQSWSIVKAQRTQYGSHSLSLFIVLLFYSYSKYIKYIFNISQKFANNNKYWRKQIIEVNEMKSATINTQKKICLKATTHPQADQHVQYTECLKSYIIKLLASA